MDFSSLKLSVYRRLNFSDTPDSAVVARIGGFINERHRALLTSPALRSLREGFGTLVSVASQPVYALPYGINRLRTVRDTTNQRTLTAISQATWRAVQPDPTLNTGTPDAFVPIGERAILRQPAGQGLWAVSSSAADTTQGVVLTAALTATTPRGFQQTTTTGLNGTTRVRLGGATDTFDDVASISLNAVTAGSVSIFDAAVAGNVIATIFAGRRTSRCYVLALSPTPGGVLTYELDYEIAVVDLANSWDEPLLPADFHDLLVHAALMDEFLHRSDDRYAIAEQHYKERLRELKTFLYGHRAALAPVPAPELAPLGPWYPRQGGWY